MKFLALLFFISLGLSQTKTTTVYLVRHAEKELNQGKDPNLTKAGEKRAKALVSQLKSVPISAIFSSNYKRTQQTAAPLAEDRKLSVKSYNPFTSKEIAAHIKAAQGAEHILVVGHSNTLEKTISALGGAKIAPISDSDYTNFFILTLTTVNGKTAVSLSQLHL